MPSASDVSLTALEPLDGRMLPTAPGPRGAFVDPWFRRVCEVDAGTLEELVRDLVHLRRIKFGIATLMFVGGACMFGGLQVDNLAYRALIHGTLACIVGMPALATGSLAVRHLFLKAAGRHGLSRTSSMLILTRAERTARHLPPLLGIDDLVQRICEEVRDWDKA